MAAVATRLKLKVRRQEEPQGPAEHLSNHSSASCHSRKQVSTIMSVGSRLEASGSSCRELVPGCPLIQAPPRVSKRPQLLFGLNSGRTAVPPSFPAALCQRKLFLLKPEFGKLTPRESFLDRSVSRLSSEFDIEEKNMTNCGNQKDFSGPISAMNLPSIDRSDTNQPEVRQSEENFLIPVVDTCESRKERRVLPSQSAPTPPASSSKALCAELLNRDLQKPITIEEKTFRSLLKPLGREGARKSILRSSGRYSSRQIDSQMPDLSRFGESGRSIPYTMGTGDSQKRVQFSKNKIIKVFRRSDLEIE